mmetsp:Transcript_39189/g.44778  ORF Transcript_39189/g.44778 Transcript_39189/m.44778 type:complete len:107 (-) Transcript_39189:118-438(-)
MITASLLRASICGWCVGIPTNSNSNTEDCHQYIRKKKSNGTHSPASSSSSSSLPLYVVRCSIIGYDEPQICGNKKMIHPELPGPAYFNASTRRKGGRRENKVMTSI